MVFFQAALLAAYAYVHLATTRLGVRRQAALHAGLLLLPLWCALGPTSRATRWDAGSGGPGPSPDRGTASGSC